MRKPQALAFTLLALFVQLAPAPAYAAQPGAMGALWARAKEKLAGASRARQAAVARRLEPARIALQSRADQVESSISSPGERSATQLVVARARHTELVQSIDELSSGQTIGSVIRQIDRKVRDNGRLAKQLKAQGREQAADVAALAQAREQLDLGSTGMRLAVSDLLKQAHGMRGSSTAIEGGLSLQIPFVGGLGFRLGLQVNGPDTGRMLLRPFIRLGVGGNLGPLGARGNAVLGMINGAYPTVVVGVPGIAAVGFSPNDPVSPNKVSLKVALLRLSLAGTRTIGAELSAPIPITPTFGVLVENTKVAGVRDRLLGWGPIARQRAQLPLLDRALSDTPPTMTELVAAVRGSTAQWRDRRGGPKVVPERPTDTD